MKEVSGAEKKQNELSSTSLISRRAKCEREKKLTDDGRLVVSE